MQQCLNCGHHNRDGVVFCENCGASIIGQQSIGTRSFNKPESDASKLNVDSSVLTDVKVQGMSSFQENTSLRLEIEGSPEPIVFKPQAETIFGRRDPATGAMPDIDLTPFAGYRMGVSRRHAAIRLGEDQTLDLWDLGSSNGTYLNDERLSAHRPYRLHDGDNLRLGQMLIRIFFQQSDKAAMPREGAPSLGASPARPAQRPTPERKAPPAAPKIPLPLDDVPITVPLDAENAIKEIENMANGISAPPAAADTEEKGSEKTAAPEPTKAESESTSVPAPATPSDEQPKSDTSPAKEKDDFVPTPDQPTTTKIDPQAALTSDIAKATDTAAPPSESASASVDEKPAAEKPESEASTAEAAPSKAASPKSEEALAKTETKAEPGKAETPQAEAEAQPADKAPAHKPEPPAKSVSTPSGNNTAASNTETASEAKKPDEKSDTAKKSETKPDDDKSS